MKQWRNELNTSATIPFETVEQIRKEWSERTTMKSLSAKYGVPVETIKSWIYYDSRVNK